jgi:hypothetical protein
MIRRKECSITVLLKSRTIMTEGFVLTVRACSVLNPCKEDLTSI